MKSSVLYIFFLFVIGCSSNKNIENKEVIYYGKTACLGKCPVLDIFIYKEGIVIYNGIKNVEKKGKHRFKISKKTFQEIKNEVAKIDFNTVYTEDLKRDLPKTIIKINGKKAVFQNPKKIKRVEELFNKLILKN